MFAAYWVAAARAPAEELAGWRYSADALVAPTTNGFHFVGCGPGFAYAPWPAGAQPFALTWEVEIEHGQAAPWRWPGVAVAVTTAPPGQMGSNDFAIVLGAHLEGLVADVRQGPLFAPNSNTSGWPPRFSVMSDASLPRRFELNQGGAGGRWHSVEWPAADLEGTRLAFRVARTATNSVQFTFYHAQFEAGREPWWQREWPLPAAVARADFQYVTVQTTVNPEDFRNPGGPPRGGVLTGWIRKLAGQRGAGAATWTGGLADVVYQPFDDRGPHPYLYYHAADRHEEFHMEAAQDMALAYDALFAELPARLRDPMQRYLERVATVYVRNVKRNSWWYADNPSNTIAVGGAGGGAAGLALMHCRAVAQEAVALAGATVKRSYRAMAPDGGCVEGSLYWNYGLTAYLRLGHMLQGATGDDAGLLDTPALRHNYRFVETQLGGDGMFFTFNDTQPWLTGLAICADLGSRFDQPLLLWMADYMANSLPGQKDRPGEVSRGDVVPYAFLWRSRQPAPPEFPGVPTASHLETLNWGVLRSDGTFQPKLVVGVKGRDGVTTHHAQPDLGSFVGIPTDRCALVHHCRRIPRRRAAGHGADAESGHRDRATHAGRLLCAARRPARCPFRAPVRRLAGEPMICPCGGRRLQRRRRSRGHASPTRRGGLHHRCERREPAPKVVRSRQPKFHGCEAVFALFRDRADLTRCTATCPSKKANAHQFSAFTRRRRLVSFVRVNPPLESKAPVTGSIFNLAGQYGFCVTGDHDVTCQIVVATQEQAAALLAELKKGRRKIEQAPQAAPPPSLSNEKASYRIRPLVGPKWYELAEGAARQMPEPAARPATLLPRAAHAVEKPSKFLWFGCRDCGDCSLPDVAYLCPMISCSKGSRNGPCGGSHDGDCELSDKECIWARSFPRWRQRRKETRTNFVQALSELTWPSQV
jgi:hypothetical protein